MYTNDIKGMMGDEDLNWLHEKAKTMDSIVEIGCWMGKSCAALLSGCKGNVYAVDHFEGSSYEDISLKQAAKELKIYDSFLKNVGSFENLVVMKMTSLEAFEKMKDQKIDMVFIDGEHRYKDVYADIESWSKITTKLICGHDVKHPPVERAAIQLLGEFKLTNQNIWYKEL